ncbi:O-methyltransferase [Virgibacillus xinjiangensis]|uniref:tRNA 5-hydroxyuridine methyltransferase n=1 Tax=Virgibacillus xinjiangensis TaxID=393090 RepID=A0ABV7CRS6_9BACI
MEHSKSDYLLGILPEKEEWVQQMETYAKEHRVPIMDSVSMNFVMQLIRLKKPARILEIGTAIGYSALMMAEAAPLAEIVSIERDEERYRQAENHITGQGRQDQIRVILGDALDELDTLRESGELFDWVFIDAAKGQYRKFFELAEPILSDSGVIISDNVLFRGLVANPEKAHQRHRKMVEKISSYNRWICSHSGFDTSIVPIGDGVAISVKKGRG